MSAASGPDIIEDGLVLCLDAGNRGSYPASGTVWTDLASTDNGTLTNGPTFNSANGGSIVFDGVNDYVGVNNENIKPTTGITQECWLKVTGIVQVFIGLQYGNGTSNSYALWWGETGTNSWNAGVNIAGTFRVINFVAPWPINRWFNFAHTYNGSEQRMYYNGALLAFESRTGPIVYDNLNTTITIGGDFNGTGYNTGLVAPVNGNISIVRIYNRGLSQAEVRQNYNATKGRFLINN